MEGMEKVASHPLAGNAAIGQMYSASMFGADLKTANCFDELMELSQKIERGDLRAVEQMLIGQASALNAMFGHFSHIAMLTKGLREQETRIRIALKAQAQCRTTLEALAEIKNPRPVAFVKAQQANIASGHQQVNNGVPPATLAPAPAPAPAGESKSAQNELLEVNHGERLDTRTASQAINADPAMATLEEVDGATHS